MPPNTYDSVALVGIDTFAYSQSRLRIGALISTRISPFQDTLQLLVGPGIEVNRLDSADMGAHSSVDA